jgi:hypothetical protein
VLKTVVDPRNTGLQEFTDGFSRTRRLFKKAKLLTRPTLARRDAPCPMQSRSE